MRAKKYPADLDNLESKHSDKPEFLQALLNFSQHLNLT